jgi:hypothetical protein
MKHNRMAVIGVLGALMCANGTALAAEENLLSNGTFDTDLAGWEVTNPEATTWSPADADGAAGSGSAEIDLPPRASGSLRSVCLPVVGGTDYVFRGSLKASASFYVSFAGVSLRWWQGAACDSDSSTVSILWRGHDWKKTTRIVSAPAEARSATVVLIATVSGTQFFGTDGLEGRSAALAVKFDNISFAAYTSGGITTTSSSTTSSSTTTTTPTCGGICGDPIVDATAHAKADATAAVVTSSDALYVLEAAVGQRTCEPCICDVNGSGVLSATDAQLTLAAATGVPVALTCPE